MAEKSHTSGSDKDVGWQHGYCKDPKNKVSVTCNYCNKEAKGGIYRLKQHLVGGFRSVTSCTKVPEHVKEEINQYMVKKKTLKDQISLLPDIDEADINDEEENEVEVSDPRGKRKTSASEGVENKRARQGPTEGGGSIHSFFKPANASDKGKGSKQTTINNAYKKELREKACTDLARWLYEAAIPFNAVKLDSFKVALDSVGRYGIGIKAPSYHEVRVPLLRKEVAHTNDLLKSHREEWAKTGCSIMSDGWVDRNNRSIINFLVNCSRGSLFLESVDASAYSQTGEKKLELLSRIIEKVGPSNIVQVVTDNDSTYKYAGQLLEVKYPHMFWTPCAAHCLDLMMEDIRKIPTIDKTIKRAIEVSVYIYQRVGLVNLMRKYTNQKNLIRPAKTRFATSFLTLQSFHTQKGNLRKMFASTEWTGSKWAKEQGGKRACQTILMISFWNSVLYTLKVTSPLVDVLRLVDGEKKPAMGYIYEAMDRAKERIAAQFNGLEEKYKDIYKIIDKRWDCQLHRPLHAAGYFLNPEFYYSNSDAIGVDEEVMNGLYKCLEKSIPDIEVQDQISHDISKYKRANGLFGSKMAIRHRTMKAPADWWSAYGSSTPALQKFAIKVLSLTCSSSGCERNWSVFEQVRKLLYLFSKKKLESQGPPRQLSGGRFLRGRGHANHRFRQVASSNRSFRKDQVISGHKSHKFGQTFPTMCPEYSYCNYERSSGPYDRKEQAVGVGNIDEQDCGRSLAAKLNFGYEHQEESPFTPTFSDTYFEDPLADLGVRLDARRLVAVSGSSDKQWNVESPVKLNLSAKYPSDNFRRAPEDFRTKGNDWFEGENYQENLSILPQSRAFPSFSSQKLNTSPPSSKYSMEDGSFKHDPAVLSMLSQQTLYEDAVVTTTLPYNPDAPYLHNRNSPSVGVMHRLSSFPPSDNNHAGLAVPTDNQSVPSYSSSLMLTNVGTRSRNCIADLYDKRHDNKTSLAESLSYKIRATEILNEGYDDFSYMEPSLPCTFSETIHDMVKSDKVSLYSAQHEVLGPSVTFGRHSAASRDTFDKNLPAYGRNVKFEADSLMLKSYPKSLDLHRSNLLDPSVHKDSESPYSGHRQASVFSRLSLAPKVRKEKKYHLLSNADTLDASVDELMAMLHHNNQHWGKARCNLVAKVNPAESFKRKREAMFNSKETTDLSKSTSMKMETEGSSEIDDNKSDNPNGVPFVDFRRRNRASKDLCDRLSAGSSRIAQEDDPSVGQQKRRKLVRPNFSKNEACENWDTCNSFQIENVSQVHGSPSHILTRAMEDSIHHDNENKVSLVVGSPHVRHGICTVDENFGSQTKQVESRASLGRSAEGKVLSSEQQKRRRLVRPNFDESKEPQERDMYLSAKMEPTPIAKCPVSEDNIGSAMVSVNCIKGDTSEDGKFSHLLCPSDPKGTIVDSQEQTVVSPGACFLTDGERNVLPENGCA